MSISPNQPCEQCGRLAEILVRCPGCEALLCTECFDQHDGGRNQKTCLEKKGVKPWTPSGDE
jgi:hypothetical protein